MTNKGLNAQEVLEVVDRYIKAKGKYRIREVYKELSIFDWWPDWLYHSNLLEMRKFLKEAIKLGFTGYVCFKVGATGCANGMWAHLHESADGYSPEGAFIYKSFTPDYNYWQMHTEDGDKLTEIIGVDFDSLTTIRDFEDAYNKYMEMIEQ